MPGIELTNKWYFSIFGKMTMIKGVYKFGTEYIRYIKKYISLYAISEGNPNKLYIIFYRFH